MTELPQNHSGKELLERIRQMETLVEALAGKLQKLDKRVLDFDRLDTQRMRLIERDQADAFERIKNIELKFFPQLAGDIIRISDIIGEGEQKADNPLDRRKP